MERIKKEGPLTFEAFMEMALYEPDMGYYTSESTEIGRAGDYYTSPHLHPVFGAMVGRQVAEMWEVMGRPPGFTVVECGAGRGFLASDMLDYLKNKEIFGSLNYRIIEINPHLRERQKALLSVFKEKVKWDSSIDEFRENPFDGCILSNELIDAFPVHIIEMEAAPKEVYVSLSGEEFKEIKGPPSTEELTDYIRDFSIELEEGYRTEINLRARQWLKGASSAISEGFILTVDYGYPLRDYYSEERTRGTLLCYRRHRASEDPYVDVGRQDITAHVNFSALKRWGEEFSLKTLGFCRQGAYLASLGIDEVIMELYGNSPDYLYEVSKIKGLIMPGTIGDTHKVMVQYKGAKNPALRGFSLRNQTKTL